MEDTSDYRSPLLDLDGAVAAAPDDPQHRGVDVAGVAWHYGDPFGEQRAIGSGGVWIDRSQRRVLKVSGPDAAEYLNNLLSQQLIDAADGFTAEALDLDAQGHVAHHAFVSVTGSEFYLDLPAGPAASLKSYLEKMVFWAQVTIEEPPLGVVTVLGGSLPTGLDAATLSRRVDWLGPERWDVLVDRGQVARVAEQLSAAGLRPAGLMAFTAERIKALEPEQEADLDHKSIAHEVAHWIGRGDRLGAVHLHKGCYRGQETVSRVENVGRSPRLMVLLQLDGSDPQLPAPGTPLQLGGRAVGRLGSVAHDCDDGPIALGIVKRSALNRGQLTAGSTACLVDPDSLPTDEGEHAGRVAIDRLRAARNQAEQ
ncbi:CAF17-like 4Fe-4S cluster assembly/insertion protein YgfZ [Corynebacterium atypicum]|uniref:CAF17-like 4Fe-4S cluster assembly/insertion protein YgfZ n=1 Tax=Corynebacterium atypicum TaxID=191610 RepID=UPI0005716C1B|nr:folate-binding protein YgfZ [Corynebacterium atypicum]